MCILFWKLCITMLFCDLEGFFLPTIAACSFFRSLRDHSLRHRSARPVVTYVCASQWTLATVPMITCDFAGRSRGMIVPTLDDLTLVISVTLLCPLGRTPHANISTTCMLCIALQHEGDRSPLQRRWTRQVTFAANHQTCTYKSHSHGGTTDSTQSPLAIDTIDTEGNKSYRATRTKMHWISFNQFSFQLVLSLCQISHWPSPQTCTYKGHKHTDHGATNRSSLSTQSSRNMRQMLFACFFLSMVLPLRQTSRLPSPREGNLQRSHTPNAQCL